MITTGHFLPAFGFSGRRACVSVHLILVALTWIVFGQTLRHDFVNYDDPNYVYANPAIAGGLHAASMQWAFTHIHAQNWHPLTTLSHMLDCQLFGLNPAGHHFTNVMLHTCVTLLLFELLRRMTGAMWRSAFVAAIFAIHPLRVESVAWIAERKDVLSGLFFMLTLASYLDYVRRLSLGSYLLVVFAFSLGLLAKPMLVTLPFVLLLLDRWPLLRLRKPDAQQHSIPHVSFRRAIFEKVPLLCLSAASCFATLAAQQQYIGSGEDLPLEARLINVGLSYVAYLRQMFWPTGLTPFYPHRESTVPVSEVITAVALLAAVTVIAMSLRNSRPYVTTGWFWYLGMLVPVIGIVQVGWQARADRYTYLTQIGLYIAIIWAAADLLKKWRARRQWIAVAAGVIIIALTSAAFVQASYWRDSERLWTRALAVNPDNDVAQNNFGLLLLGRGRPEEARPHFEAALRLRPDNAAAHVNLGNVFVMRGDLVAGIAHLRRALDLDPDNAYAANLLGVAMLQRGDVAGALAQWNEILEAHPDDGNAMSNLAWIYATSPRSEQRDGRRAVDLATRAAAIAHDKNALVLRTLAAAYAETGRFDEAVASATIALQLAKAQKNSGLIAELQPSIALYESHRPLRDPSLAREAD